MLVTKPGLNRAAMPLIASLLVLAGCLEAPSQARDTNLPFLPELPPGCSRNQTATSYTPSGNASRAEGFGCLHETRLGTYEPTIGVHPKTGNVFLYPVYGNLALGPISMARSDDQGATWRTLTPSIAAAPAHPYSLDPFLYLDPKTGRIFIDDLITPECSILSFSDDEGITWTHSATPCTQGDHINIFAGKPTRSTTLGYPNVVYRCGINTFAVLYASFSSTCQKSLDGGLTWINTGAPAFTADPRARGIQGVNGWCDGGVGHGSVAPDGTVYLGKGVCGTPMAAISTDEGLTWRQSKISDLGMMVMFCNGWDHEVNIATDPSGNAYAFWIDNQHVPRLAISRDQGRTWGPGIDVRPAGVTQASLPQLAVGADGKVAMLYMASTNAPTGSFPRTTQTDPTRCELAGNGNDPAYRDVTWDAYITLTVNALDAEPEFTSVTANDPSRPLAKGKCDFRCPGFGDFIDIQIGPDGTPWAALVAPCSSCGGNGPGGPAVVGRVFAGPNLLAS